MSRKNNLQSFECLNVNGIEDVTSAVTCIQWLDNIGIQIDLGEVLTGTLHIEVSANHLQDTLGNVLAEGTWAEITSTDVTSGDPSPVYFDLNQLSAPWIRLRWENTATVVQEITTVADVGGSLNETWFTIQGANGTTYGVWINVDGGGVEPDMGDVTAVPVAISEDDSANDVATAVAAALDALAPFVSAAVGAVVTVTNSAAGGCAAAADSSQAPTGFTFEITDGGGELTAVITAKML